MTCSGSPNYLAADLASSPRMPQHSSHGHSFPIQVELLLPLCSPVFFQLANFQERKYVLFSVRKKCQNLYWNSYNQGKKIGLCLSQRKTVTEISVNVVYESVCMLSHFSRVWLFEGLWTIACQAPWNFPGKNTDRVAMPPCKESSWLRDWTCISHISSIDRQFL